MKKERSKKNRTMWIVLAGFLFILLLPACQSIVPPAENVLAYREKAALLQEQALSPLIVRELGKQPAGSVGHAVFFSVCDTAQRASVYSGAGETLEAAWEAANSAAESALQSSGLEPVWVKVDVAYLNETVPAEEIHAALRASWNRFFRYGIAFDQNYETALLEAELNSAQIYQYEEGSVDLEALNAYLSEAGRPVLQALPADYTVFQCFSWFCDEEKVVHQLDGGGLEYGRRTVEEIDAAYAQELIYNAADFLMDQMREDGSFIYGYSPSFDEELSGYNMIRHASAIRGLLFQYQLAPTEELAGLIERALEYMLTQVVYENDETAYLYEETSGEIKLGGCALAVVALTEYMEVFQSEQHMEACQALGNGILALMDQETGTYYHVLNDDFTIKEAFRTVYYDGEATFALCKLYGLTEEEIWLDAAKSAVDHFIEADYTQYKDHWIACSMNEITKYVKDNVDYYTFALKNILVNLEEIYDRDTTYHTYLEMLLATFEVYDRMLEQGAVITNFDLELLLKTIYARADRMLDGYLYPEYAMYMKNPQRILHTFMVRQEDYRVRIDDVHHNISSYYMYYKNYDKLVSYGMLEAR